MKRFIVPGDITIKDAKELGLYDPKKLVRRGKKETQHIPINYTSVPKDLHGWIDASIFLPTPYDLCQVKCETNLVKNGWWVGSFWMGKNIKKEDKVMFWRRREELTHYESNYEKVKG